MALNKLKFNSLNVTPTASKTIGFNSSANGLEATFSGGDMQFIKKLTASSSSTLSFVDGSSDVVLDNTYKEYLFIFKDIHPSVNGAKFSFQGNAAGGSGYNETITSSSFRTYHNEADNDTTLSYTTSGDQAQGTGFQLFSETYIGNDNDQCGAGFLHLFNPSSTTFVKHFIGTFQVYDPDDYSSTGFFAGYFNTTSAIDEIQFKMHSGDIDAGTITLYGIN